MRLAAELRNIVNVINSKQNQTEQYLRKNNIRFFGVTDNKNERAEETFKLVSEIIKKKLNLTQFSGLDIDKAHRVGNFQANTDRAIIARFTTHRAAELVLANRRALKGSIIAEDLTAETSQLFRKVKEMDRVQQVWTKRGVIFFKDRDNNILKVLPHDTIQTLQKRLTQQQKTRGSNQKPTGQHRDDKPIERSSTEGRQANSTQHSDTPPHVHADRVDRYEDEQSRPTGDNTDPKKTSRHSRQRRQNLG
ncbi:hypothetical protein ElyMa_003073700 [Elysia marginata]|uniref:Uncharacterized protein n=1 Tax=Elysia marginata TaxID=1093978 RepID=A0AAV4ILI7_9GAST|nr:hypothetical protein ElyMa_003073700 [Elysia marginata]